MSIKNTEHLNTNNIKELKKKIEQLESEVITQKETINRLTDTANQLNTITKVTPSLITVFDCKKNNNIYQNRSLLELLGYSKKYVAKHLNGKGNYSLIHPEDVKNIEDSFEEIKKFQNGQKHVLEYRVKDKNGKWQWVRKVSAVFQKDDKGRPSQIISSHDIITDQRLAEERTKENEEKFRSIFENAYDVIVIVDKYGKIMEINDKIENIIGVKRKELIGKNFFSLRLFKLNDIVSIVKDFRKTVKTGVLKGDSKSKDFYISDFQITTNNNETKYLSAGTTMLKEKGKIKGFLSIIHDITELKRAEEETSKIRWIHEKIGEVSPGIISIYDLREKTEFYKNRTFGMVLEYNGKSPEPVSLTLEDEINKYIHPDDKSKTEKFLKDVRKLDKKQVLEIEFRLKDFWGNWKWYSRISRVLEKDKNGKLAQILNIFTDITSKKNAEETLRKSEDFNRAITEHAPIGISVRSNKGRLLSYNNTWKKIWNKTDKSIFEDITKFRTALAFDENDAYLGAWAAKVKSIYEKGGTLYIPELKTKLSKKDMAEWVSNYFYAIKDIDGKVQRIVILTEDITERKHAELKLIETKQLLEKITATTPAIISVSDLSTNTNIYQNRSLLEMLGYSKNEVTRLVKNPDEINNIVIHPDDLDRISSIDKNLKDLKDDKSYELEYRIKNRKGGWEWIRRIFSVFQRDEKGIPSHIVSIFENITQNKNAQDTLKESEETAQALINTISESVLMFDMNGIILSLNDTAAKRLDSSKEELIGKSVFGFFNENVNKFRKEMLHEVVRTKQSVSFRDERDGRFYESIMYPLFDNNRDIIKIIVFAKDITEHLLAERAIKESEERYRNLIESSPDGIIVHYNGKILFANNSCASLLGYDSADELTYKNVFDFLHPRFKAEVDKRISKIIGDSHRVPLLEEKFRKKDGSYIDVEVTALPFNYKGDTAVQVIARDITFRKKAEKELAESEERYRAFITQSTEGIYRMELEKPIDISLPPQKQVKNIFKYCRIAECNDAMAFMYGYNKSSELVGMKLIEMYGGENPEDVLRLTEFVISGYKSQNTETEEKDKNGKLKYFVNNAVGIVQNGYLTRIWGTQTDMTVLKEKESEVRKLLSAVDQSPVSIVITDKEGKIEFVNPKFSDATGYSAGEAIGQNPRILKSGETPSEEYKKLWDTLAAGNEWVGEFHNKKKNGELFWESALLTPIKNDKGETERFLAIKQDITEQKAKDEKLKQSLKEKEVMLREIHHRVKNNLQIISSLLKLQGGYTNDPVASEYLRISQHRVKTMALIHQQLYRSDDLSKIDFEEYMKQLKGHLFAAYGTDRDNITSKIRAKDIYLSIDKAIPCGLIVNELVSNSLKHAFGDSRKGNIEISVTQENDFYYMIVKDNGKGIPPNIDYRNTQSLGMQLVITLTEQLGGEIHLNSEAGTEFNISFPVN